MLENYERRRRHSPESEEVTTRKRRLTRFNKTTERSVVEPNKYGSFREISFLTDYNVLIGARAQYMSVEWL